MINLQSTREPVDPATVAQIPVAAGRQLYVSRTQIDGQTWYRLRLGFFGSESDARQTYNMLSTSFPRAWIGRAEPEEVATASEYTVQSAPDSPLPLFAAEEIESAPDTSVLLEKPAEEILAQMSAAREAMPSSCTPSYSKPPGNIAPKQRNFSASRIREQA